MEPDSALRKLTLRLAEVEAALALGGARITRDTHGAISYREEPGERVTIEPLWRPESEFMCDPKLQVSRLYAEINTAAQLLRKPKLGAVGFQDVCDLVHNVQLRASKLARFMKIDPKKADPKRVLPSKRGVPDDEDAVEDDETGDYTGEDSDDEPSDEDLSSGSEAQVSGSEDDEEDEEDDEEDEEDDEEDEEDDEEDEEDDDEEDEEQPPRKKSKPSSAAE